MTTSNLILTAGLAILAVSSLLLGYDSERRYRRRSSQKADSAKKSRPAEPGDHLRTLQSAVELRLQRIIADYLELPQDEVGLDRPLSDIGLDSLTALGIRGEVRNFSGILLSSDILRPSMTIRLLAAYLIIELANEQLSNHEGADFGAPSSAAPTSGEQQVLPFTRPFGIWREP